MSLNEIFELLSLLTRRLCPISYICPDGYKI
jgi:hypothetical protein